MYADDVKIYRTISSVDDSHLLQQDLHNFYRWLLLNGMDLTLSKCAVMQFSRARSPHTFQYFLASHVLNTPKVIKDLGVIFDQKLDFSQHILSVSMRCRRLLGYVSRISKGLSSDAFLILYCSLVRSILEYASVVWSPYYKIHSISLDRVQSRFLSSYRYRYHHVPIQVADLSERREMSDIKFIDKLIEGKIDCPKLLSLLTFDCHLRRTRCKTLFRVSSCRTNYTFFSPLNRLMRIKNTLNKTI